MGIAILNVYLYSWGAQLLQVGQQRMFDSIHQLAVKRLDIDSGKLFAKLDLPNLIVFPYIIGRPLMLTNFAWQDQPFAHRRKFHL